MGKRRKMKWTREVEGEKEENAQRRRHMCMDGMEVKRQMRSALSQCEV